MKIQREVYVSEWVYYSLLIGGSGSILGLIAYAVIMLV